MQVVGFNRSCAFWKALCKQEPSMPTVSNRYFLMERAETKFVVSLQNKANSRNRKVPGRTISISAGASPSLAEGRLRPPSPRAPF